MGFWTYYSPLGIGVVLALVLHEAIWAHAPAMPAWGRWPFVAGVAVGVGLLCQLMLIGVQGAFAQVLPVPVGRSIRGPGAMLGGWLIIVAIVLGAAGGLLRSEELHRAGLVIVVLGLLAAAGALITYVWCWPTAVRDFGKDAR
jgi:hypothetical protein